MLVRPIPLDEAQRLTLLAGHGLLGAAPEPACAAVAEAAARVVGAPVGLVSVLGPDEHWLKARWGPGPSRLPREHALCTRVVLGAEPLVVPDAQDDPRFARSPLVAGEGGVRFYAGVPIVSDAGEALGALCAIDHRPRREWGRDGDPEALAALARLARVVATLWDQRRDLRLRDAVGGLARASGLALATTDAAGRISFWNPAAEDLFGHAAAEAVGRDVELIVPERFREHHHRGLARLRAGGEPRLVGKPVEVMGLHRDGHEFPIEVTLSAWAGPEGWEFGAFIQDISARHARDVRLRHLAAHDPLTGLPNRRELRARLEAALEEDGRAAVLALDLDGFKVVNDTLGHPVGDDLLRMSAVALAARVDGGANGTAMLARIGGDEFALLLPGCDDAGRAAAQAQALLGAFDEGFAVAGHELRLAASVGFALAPAHARDADELLVRADLALLEAKREGGRARAFDRALEAGLAAQRALTDEVRQATLDRQWALHYQPQVRMGDGRPVGAEALLRWRHPTRGLIGPALFLATLETHAMAGEVGRWVIDEACAELARWRARGLDLPGVSVNLFAVQLRLGGVERAVADALGRHGLAPGDLELELTETTVLRQDARAIGELTALRRAGVRLAFDDFGTGFASLTTVKDFAVDKVKIDRSFVKDLPGDAHSRAIAGSMVHLARELGLAVVAEGVETAEQRDALMALGCEVGQGYLWGRPVPGPEALAAMAAAPAP